jgi:D-serine deaminase-like pyridoxal phosphate-dependent protein
MLISPIGWSLDRLDTPALLLDLDAFERNAETMASHILSRGLNWRPHTKAIKSPAIAQRLRAAGAMGVTVAKVSEAEIMAGSGLDDILIAHLVIGPAKAARLAALQRIATVRATVDSPSQLPALSEAAQNAGVGIGLLVDVNLGMDRTGVDTPEAAVALARAILGSPGLRFDGLMGYEGHTLLIPEPDAKREAIRQAIGRLRQAVEAVKAAGFPCPIVSAGGTGSYQFTADEDGVTELQAGGGVFACRYYTEACGVVGHTPALHVLATVVSRPAPDRVILDIGQKSISGYRTSPVLASHPDCLVETLSAEHTRVAVPADSAPTIGDRVMVIPGYSDFTTVLHDRILAHRQGRVEAVWPLLGRGQLQ